MRASSSKHNQFYSEFRSFTSRSAHNTNSFNKISHLGNGYFKTPLGSHRQYVTNVIREQKSRKMLYYLTGLVFAMVGCTYAAVPLYRRFCQATGYGGTVQRREVCTKLSDFISFQFHNLHFSPINLFFSFHSADSRGKNCTTFPRWNSYK